MQKQIPPTIKTSPGSKTSGDVVVIRNSGYYGLSPIPPSRVRVSPFMYLKSGEAS